ncbi:MAG: HYR domain-containing protein [Saprospiraceae bacterium]|nr:HYR domain-containing protein [Saprospiraceae bacterium]
MKPKFFISTMACRLWIPAFLFLLCIEPASAQVISQRKGVDQSIQYETVKRFGPWDDRNYQLTAADLQLLAPNENELSDPIPAFFRVELRKRNPNLPRTGEAQYPRSALQLYIHEHGGYLYNNKMYNKLEMENGFMKIKESPDEPSEKDFDPSRFLAGELRITTPIGAAESAIKINPVDPNRVIAGVNGPTNQQDMFFSTDGGETWTLSNLPLGNTCCDPTVDWSSNGQTAYAAALGFNAGSIAVWFYRSSDFGQTWTDLNNVTPGDPRRELTTGNSDKEFLHVDKHVGSPFRDNVYLTWHNANVMQFARSTDQGNTWTTTSFDADPRGIGSDITTDRNGNIYYFYPATTTRQILLKRSTDGGATFPAGTILVSNTNGGFDFPIPSMETRRAWIYVSADSDLSNGPFGGSIYACWTDTYGAESATAADNHTRVLVAHSRDGGNTWTVVTPHPTADQNTVDRWNPWMAVGRDGTVHVIYYDTRHSVNRTGVDLYYSFSTDGGQTFSTPKRLTSETSPNLTDLFEFGDYNGLDHVVCQIAIYTDNRDEGGVGGNSPDVYTIGIDNTDPSIICPSNITTDAAPGQCSRIVNFTPIATDDCSAVAISSTPASGANFNVGTVTVTAKATDAAGNTKTCQFSVTVQDLQPPAIVCPANFNQSCELPITPAEAGSPVTLDNCGVATVTHSDVQVNGSCIGEFNVFRNWKVVDVHGNMNACVQEIKVTDKKAPVVTCPASITVTCVTNPSATGTANSVDNCDPSPVLAFADGAPVGDCDWLCTFTRTWTSTDDCGNAKTCAQSITKSALEKVEEALSKDVTGDGRPDPLVLGHNNSTLTIPAGKGNCVIQWLPSTGSTASALKFEKATILPTCKPGTNPLDVNGKLVNPLVAEALKLHIFVRLKPSLGMKKLSEFSGCVFAPIILQALAPEPDVNELLRVTQLALGNVALQPHLTELLAALSCITGPLDVCNL